MICWNRALQEIDIQLGIQSHFSHFFASIKQEVATVTVTFFWEIKLDYFICFSCYSK